MIKVQRFINQLMTSNCYVVFDDETKRCLVIDPASEKSLEEIKFIKENNLSLDYIIITHEHTDHNWGVNSLKEHFPESQFVCSELCSKNVKKINRAYFLLYFDDLDYFYEIAQADLLISEREDDLNWSNHIIRFILTPGHSHGSMCIEIGGMLFTGDTIMPYMPYFNGRDSNKNDWKISINTINRLYTNGIKIQPGHGDTLNLKDWNLTYSLFD